MGVAVFVDLDDDVLAELKLGTSADEITALGTDYYGSGIFAAPTTDDPVCVDGTDGHFVHFRLVFGPLGYKKHIGLLKCSL